MTGIAWNVRIMTVKVLDCRGNGAMENVAQGIEYAVRNGARVPARGAQLVLHDVRSTKRRAASRRPRRDRCRGAGYGSKAA